MKVRVFDTPAELGAEAARVAAAALRDAIRRKGGARLMLSTGASQLDTLSCLVREDVDWQKVEMFHLDEYVSLPETHPASFRRYLKERFIAHVKPGKVNLVTWEGDLVENMRRLSAAILAEPVDLGLIGIGENAHIAFNDPPADFDIDQPYIIVTLDAACRRQQVGEGWFPDAASVPDRAITASVRQIMRCEKILSCVPFAVKAEAVRAMLEGDVTNLVPATMLKRHPDATLFLDKDSAAFVPREKLAEFGG